MGCWRGEEGGGVGNRNQPGAPGGRSATLAGQYAILRRWSHGENPGQVATLHQRAIGPRTWEIHI